MTPFLLATNQSRFPKSVRRVMIEAGCGIRTAFYGRGRLKLQFLKFDFDDFILDSLDGRLHFDKVTDAFSDQRPTDRRLNRDPVKLHVGPTPAAHSVLALFLRLALD